jgi:hypothetical protein
MKEIERIMDRRYTILTLAILERAYRDATQTRKPTLAMEAKQWISQNAWSLVELLDIPISEKEYLKWLSEIEPRKKGRTKEYGKWEFKHTTKETDTGVDRGKNTKRCHEKSRDSAQHVL